MTDGTSAAAPGTVTAAGAEAAPVEAGLPEGACETLYIQNLNETVKIEGTYHGFILFPLVVSPGVMHVAYAPIALRVC